MPSQEAIEQALRNLSGVEKFLGRREIKELPSILWEDELPEKIIQGTYSGGNGLLVATNKRLIFIDKGVFSLKVEDFPYDKITSIQYTTGLLMGGIEIYASGNKAEIKNVPKDQVRPFAEYVRARITAPKPPVSQPTQQEDVLAQIERLAKLKEQGILTEEEFAAKKQELLAKL